ncbi:MAG: hypothetical protein LBS72_06120 [Oscillospiraceae bacterium]|jgi:hypothetical protein|nr:hypothetical protein [Oscillospiraceae bacterium]
MNRHVIPILLVLVLCAAVILPSGAVFVFAEGEEDDWEEYEPIALFLTNILNAEDGLGTYRYTLALPTDEPLDESEPRYASMGTLVRRLIDLDGSLGDPSDASPLADVEATIDAGFADAFAVYFSNNAIYIYRNGETLISEATSDYYTGVTYTKNKRGIPALRYTRKDGSTALIPFAHDCVVLFTGEYEQLVISSSMADEPIVLGAGCMIEKLTVNERVIMHNSGLVEESEYCPKGIQMIGIAYDEEENPITLDSGMFTTGPRPSRGRVCQVCGVEYNGLKTAQLEWHMVHVCEHEDCKYGGFWSSCAPEGSLYNAAIHAAAPWCPYGLCAVCSDTRCALCQQDFDEGRATDSQRVSYWAKPLIGEQ